MTPHPSTVTLMRNRTAADTDDRQSGGTRARRRRLGSGGTAGAPTLAELTPVDDTATNDAGTPASSPSSTSSSNKTPWVVGGIAAVVVLAGASTLLARNRRRTPLDR